jgi:hypothetical protein
MSDKTYGFILLAVGLYSLGVAVMNKTKLFSTSIPHSDNHYPLSLRRVVTILTGIILIAIGIKMIRG